MTTLSNSLKSHFPAIKHFQLIKFSYGCHHYLCKYLQNLSKHYDPAKGQYLQMLKYKVQMRNGCNKLLSGLDVDTYHIEEKSLSLFLNNYKRDESNYGKCGFDVTGIVDFCRVVHNACTTLGMNDEVAQLLIDRLFDGRTSHSLKNCTVVQFTSNFAKMTMSFFKYKNALRKLF